MPDARALIAATAMLLMLPFGLAAQSHSEDPAVPLVYSSAPMLRNAHLTLAASSVALWGVDEGLNAARVRLTNSGWGRFGRISKFVLFDIPVTSFLIGINHEYGHITRADERDLASSFRIVGTPWSWNTPFRLEALDPAVFDDIGSQVGGVEASQALKDLSERLMRNSERVSPGQALATVAAWLDTPLYALRNLDADSFDLLIPERHVPDGDAAHFVNLLVRRRAAAGRPVEFHAVRRDVRARSAMNFVDFGLWTLGHGLIADYLWNGGKSVPVRWLRVGPVELIPSLRYEWTPIGAQSSIRSHYRVSGRTGIAYLRWSDRADPERLVGGGLSISGRARRGVKPEVQIDLWTDAINGRGGHAALIADMVSWPRPAATLTVTLGAKSAGHLPTHHLRAGGYINAGLVVSLR